MRSLSGEITEFLVHAGFSANPDNRETPLSDGDNRLIFLEIKQKTGAGRELRNAIIQLATRIDKTSESKGLLILSEPGISDERLKKEWSSLREVLDKRIAEDLGLMVIRGGKARFIVPNTAFLNYEQRIAELTIANDEDWAEDQKDTRPASHFTIIKILLRKWLLNKAPISRSDLASISGYSLPTVLRSLSTLDRYLTEIEGNKIQLNEWPEKAWDELLILSEKARKTLYYSDSSGNPRSLSFLNERIENLHNNKIAYGGVRAARFWDDQFDLVGLPRIDLCLHSPNGKMLTQFIQEVDLGLSRTDVSEERVTIAIHGVFEPEMKTWWDVKSQANVADPVECILDLHEMKLTEQANALVEKFSKGGS